MITYFLAAAILVLYTLGSFLPGVAGHAIEQQLQKQYGPFERLQATVVANPPIRTVGGEVESLSIRANGFQVEGLPIATASVDTGPIGVNAGAMLFGRPAQLTHPVTATASAEVTEDGLNAFLRSPKIAKQLKGIPTQISILPGITVTSNIDVNPGRIRLQAGKVVVDGSVFMGGTTIPFAATASPRLVNEQQIALEDVQATMMGAPLPSGVLNNASLRTFDLSKYQTPAGVYRLTELSVLPGALRIGARLEVKDLLTGK
ncbi:MAG TPA: DUF2993 domain-containing protein [Stenomitos sp.]